MIFKNRLENLTKKLTTFCEEKKVNGISLKGQLIRPLISFEMARHCDLDQDNKRFLSGVLAIQMIHEASLFHDDIIDKAEMRRGEATTLNHENIVKKLMQGDYLIAQSFFFISQTNCSNLVKHYSKCNIDVIEGEFRQNKKRGAILNFEEYFTINKLKTGALFSSAAAVGILLSQKAEKNNFDHLFDLISDVGALYQILDDLLDYIPNAKTGKAPLKDFQQKKWTYLLSFCKDIDWQTNPNVLLSKLFDSEKKSPFKKSPFALAVEKFHDEAEKMKEKLHPLLEEENLIFDLISSWQKKLDLSLEKIILPEQDNLKINLTQSY